MHISGEHYPQNITPVEQVPEAPRSEVSPEPRMESEASIGLKFDIGEAAVQAVQTAEIIAEEGRRVKASERTELHQSGLSLLSRLDGIEARGQGDPRAAEEALRQFDAVTYGELHQRIDRLQEGAIQPESAALMSGYALGALHDRQVFEMAATTLHQAELLPTDTATDLGTEATRMMTAIRQVSETEARLRAAGQANPEGRRQLIGALESQLYALQQKGVDTNTTGYLTLRGVVAGVATQDGRSGREHAWRSMSTAIEGLKDITL